MCGGSGWKILGERVDYVVILYVVRVCHYFMSQHLFLSLTPFHFMCVWKNENKRILQRNEINKC